MDSLIQNIIETVQTTTQDSQLVNEILKETSREKENLQYKVL